MTDFWDSLLVRVSSLRKTTGRTKILPPLKEGAVGARPGTSSLEEPSMPCNNP